MLNVEGVVLFEIPMYLMSKEDFSNKWTKKIDSMSRKGSKNASSKDLIEIRQFHMQRTSLKRIWEYNQIVGYIVVTYCNRSDIQVDVYLPRQKRIPIDNNGIKVERQMCANNHFYISDAGEDLKIKIKDFVNMTAKYYRKKWYVNLSYFESMINNIDIDSFMEDRAKSYDIEKKEI